MLTSRWAFVLGCAWAVAACSSNTTVTCGKNYVQQGDRCVPINAAGGAGGSAGAAAGGTGGTSNAGAGGAEPLPDPSQAAQLCPQPGEVLGMTDLETTRNELIGTWMYCSGAELFQTSHDGIEIASDGHWYFLDLDNGVLVRRKGFDGGGDWTLSNSSSSVQFDMSLFAGGGVAGFVRFAKNPQKFSYGFGGGASAEYLAVAASAP